MNEHALVSITIPAYNPEFFETALLSALHQSWPNCEIIICDDSRDDTIRTLTERYAGHSTVPIRYFKNEPALREVNNVRRCIREAQGKYIKFLYDDDIIYKECVTRLVDAIESSPANRLASSRRTRIDEEGKPLVDINATAFPFGCDVAIDGADLVAFFLPTTRSTLSASPARCSAIAKTRSPSARSYSTWAVNRCPSSWMSRST